MLLSIIGLNLALISASADITVSVQSLKWIAQELAPNAEVEVLCPPGTSPHVFEPTVRALQRSSASKILLHIAKDYDGWFDKIDHDHKVEVFELLPQSARRKSSTQNHDHGHHDHDHDHKHHHHGNWDPHFWMDPTAVRLVLPGLAKKLCEQSILSCEQAQKNAASFAQRLESLESELQQLLSPAKSMAFLTSHDGFGYFADRFGLKYIDPIETIPGKEPSARDFKRLHDLITNENVRTIFGEKQLPLEPVRALAEAGNIQYKVLDQYGATGSIRSYADLLKYNVELVAKSIGPQK